MGALERVAYVQIANLFDGAAQMKVQQAAYLSEEGKIIEHKAARIALAIIVDDQITLIWQLGLCHHMPQNPHFAGNAFHGLGIAMAPNRRPAVHSVTG